MRGSLDVHLRRIARLEFQLVVKHPSVSNQPAAHLRMRSAEVLLETASLVGVVGVVMGVLSDGGLAHHHGVRRRFARLGAVTLHHHTIGHRAEVGLHVVLDAAEGTLSTASAADNRGVCDIAVGARVAATMTALPLPTDTFRGVVLFKARHLLHAVEHRGRLTRLGDVHGQLRLLDGLL